MANVVVVDTSLAFKWLLEEEDSGKAVALVRHWNQEGAQIAAPHLLLAEVSNALHRAVTDRDLSVLEAGYLLEQLVTRGLEFHHAISFYPRALALASELGQGAVYDSVYLALAESLDCELWTADARFHRAARARYEYVRLLGEFDPLA